MAQSEIAAIRQQIADEYVAAKWGLSGLAYGTAQHRFITARMENMGKLYDDLHALVGDKAVTLVAETLQDLPKQVKEDPR